jgi:membrane protein
MRLQKKERTGNELQGGAGARPFRLDGGGLKARIARVQSLFLLTLAALKAGLRRVEPLGLLFDSWEAYGRDEMGMLAAALAYYLLLSLFPLLLLLISIATPFLASERVVQETVRFAENYFPAAGVELRTILEQVLNARGPATIFAAFGLLWSASGVFDIIQRGLSRAWHDSQSRPVWRQRLVSIAAVMGIGLLFGVSFTASAFLRTGLRLRLQIGGASIEVVGLAISVALNFVLFSIVYMFLPFEHVAFRQVWGGALLVSVLWESAKIIFVVYLLNFARLSLVYGSVGAIIALLLWGYITASILFFGAEMSAVYSSDKPKEA